MQSRGILSTLTFYGLGFSPAESRVGKGDGRGTLWVYGPGVGREIVQRGQRGNGSAFLSPHPLSPLHLQLHPSLLFTAASLFFSLFSLSSSFALLPPSLLEEGWKSLFSWAFLKLFFTDISEMFHSKENIWTYFSLIGSLMATFCVPVQDDSCSAGVDSAIPHVRI